MSTMSSVAMMGNNNVQVHTIIIITIRLKSHRLDLLSKWEGSLGMRLMGRLMTGNQIAEMH